MEGLIPKPKHVHKLRKAHKKDMAFPINHTYNKGPRWILMWVCRPCPDNYSEAYDLTHDEPSGVPLR